MSQHQSANHEHSHVTRTSSAARIPVQTRANIIFEDNEVITEGGEPPDRIAFSKSVAPSSETSQSISGHLSSPRIRQESLLTQALLTSPELAPLSDVEAPVLSSDGGLISPARTTTPSPPISSMGDIFHLVHPAKTKIIPKAPSSGAASQASRAPELNTSQELKVEEGLGRRRCISFACGRQTLPHVKERQPPEALETSDEKHGATAVPPKRPCTLRFACVMKPSRTESLNPLAKEATNESVHDVGRTVGSRMTSTPKTESPKIEAPKIEATKTEAPRIEVRSDRRAENPAMNEIRMQNVPLIALSDKLPNSKTFNRINYQKSEATRFHEFAGSFNEEDEWTNEQTAYRQRLTIDDTLRKENAIRRLGQEAEDEVLEEEGQDEAATYDSEDLDNDEKEDEIASAIVASDDGNESDDEGGFAESDESCDDSEYEFWTPGITTAATSTDHVEHTRSLSHRTASMSSLGSMEESQRQEARLSEVSNRHRNGPRMRKIAPMRPSTPALPDSSDFVIGTIDEDQPREDAYLSCLEQRRRSKQKLIPQDIDPSFPTSDPEPGLDEGEAEEGDSADGWDRKAPNDSGPPGNLPGSGEESCTSIPAKGVQHDKTLRSPSVVHKNAQLSPTHRLFGQANHRLRSPPPLHRKLRSPPSSRRPSFTGSTMPKVNGIDVPRLAQRPNLTHTTSLPRTPNPFWDYHRRTCLHSITPGSASTSPKTLGLSQPDTHSRGPIDIVQGLKNKRQRRKEKFWREYCRLAHAGKEKERRCQPGKGAERMRELGLEVADRFKAYGQRAGLVLSV